MKFYRSLTQLIFFLLYGWVISSWTGSADPLRPIPPVKVAAVESTSEIKMADEVTDGFALGFFRQVIVRTTPSYKFSLSSWGLISPFWMLIDCAKQPLKATISYYFFAYFGNLLRHHISINAP